ncbi:MAG: SGNH/GDSL hydrolase family protein [Verrucomicrobia bacterium]|nr:SGNH/GDSL hydrolase family protein [Verrucomicrobiota bacterium]
MKIGDRETLLFIGDSITDCGRQRPVGERTGLGEGYVAFVDGLMAATLPEQRARVLNTGIGGNRVTDLASRWQTDVLDLKPTWLSVMIGINDVWRQFDHELSAQQVTIDQYESVYRELLAQTRPQLTGLVIMSPYFLEANRSDPMRAQMDAYGAVSRKLAGEFDALFVDVQAAFDAYLAERPSQSLCGDRVHPNKTGHMIIACAFLRAVGWSFDGATSWLG